MMPYSCSTLLGRSLPLENFVHSFASFHSIAFRSFVIFSAKYSARILSLPLYSFTVTPKQSFPWCVSEFHSSFKECKDLCFCLFLFLHQSHYFGAGRNWNPMGKLIIYSNWDCYATFTLLLLQPSPSYIILSQPASKIVLHPFGSFIATTFFSPPESLCSIFSRFFQLLSRSPPSSGLCFFVLHLRIGKRTPSHSLWVRPLTYSHTIHHPSHHPTRQHSCPALALAAPPLSPSSVRSNSCIVVLNATINQCFTLENSC